MEKRIFLAVIISIALLWIWAAIAPKIFPDLAKPRPSTSQPRGPQTAPKAAAQQAISPAPAMPAPATATTDSIAAVSVEETRVETPEFIARFSNRGAQIVSFQLKNYKSKDGSLVDLVKARDHSRTDYPFAIEASNADVARRLNESLYVLSDRLENGEHILEYRYVGGSIAATKIFRVGPEYEFHFAMNLTPAAQYRVVIGPGIRTLGPDERDSQFIVTGNGVVQREGSLKIIRREKAEAITAFDAVDFIGIEDNYFLSAIKPAKAGGAVLRRVDVTTPGQTERRRELFAGVNAAPDGGVVADVFFGPKQTNILERYGLESTLQFGWFGFIARLLLDVLVWINHATRNYGFAIIVLTIVIKIVLYPLQHKSIVSMKKMQKVQPKVEAIKQRYKKARTDAEQRQKMNAEMMKLYQQEGINPMGGCLPILLQLPILWGFYGLLSRAIELRGAPFIFWIRDLSSKDPFYITPILMTATMFIQQAITPTTADPAQRRMFLIMPLVFGWIFKEFPSGLVLYWLVQNVLTIIQQMIMNKYWKDHPAELQTV